MNRTEARTIQSILRCRDTSDAQRSRLRQLGVHDVWKRDGRLVVPDMRVDCFDVWRARALATLSACERRRPYVVHTKAYPGASRDELRRFRNATKRRRA